MAMSASRIRIRALQALAATALTLALGATEATATVLPASCTTLQAQLEAASKDPGGGSSDTVVLSGMCEGSYVLSAGSAFTLEGAPGTSSGFDGKGLSAPQLASAGFESVGGMTLAGLNFEHATHSALRIRFEGVFTLRDSRFLDSRTIEAGPVALIDAAKCAGTTGSGSLTVARSSFEAGVAAEAGGTGAGAGLEIDTFCGLDPIKLASNVFSANRVTPSTGQPGEGGGLWIGNGDALHLATAVQSGNVFDANALVADGSSSYTGGGETTLGVDLLSSGDRFTHNTLPGASAGHFSWGAGLSVENSGCQTISPSSTLADDVIAANTIIDGAGASSESAQGAGVYVGCGPPKGYANHLALLDSTVTGNAVTPSGPGAIAGIGGHPSDQLVLGNTILYGNRGGVEIGGFTDPNVTASYSDVCSTPVVLLVVLPGDSEMPLSGQGNICANPQLAGASNPNSTDAHETGSSPTIDAGSNVLLPTGLNTDFYGASRVQAGRSYLPSCTPGVSFIGPTLGPALPDIGAAEFGPVAVPAIAILCPAPKPSATFTIASIRVLRNGRIAITLDLSGPGQVTANASFTIRTAKRVRIRGHTRRLVRLTSIAYGSTSRSAHVAGKSTLVLAPTRRALLRLKRRQKLTIRLKLAFSPAGATRTLKATSIAVTYKPPPKHHHTHR